MPVLVGCARMRLRLVPLVPRVPLAPLVSLVACALVAAACSRRAGEAGADAGGAATLAHPCKLLTEGDAEEALGTSDLRMTEQPAGSPGDARCLWSVTAGRGFVELLVHVPSRKDTFGAGPGSTPLPGVGDRAYARSRASWGHVDVLKGDQTFFVQVQSPAPQPGAGPAADAAQKAAVAIARNVASRL